jgi:hypothetical protein
MNGKSIKYSESVTDKKIKNKNLGLNFNIGK